ncbi:unnamed protein product [Darwinula stevensoni]|uniref:Protein neuralized n=1 Tax=Darwinula stevensoni TaxID=69355 RepID=A0A7R8X940_9CRUS|nr:unnamed protein product [Darwinula stevensoni]CAG0890281.1 unnamed protein product [Darwinula stevensoni]
MVAGTNFGTNNLAPLRFSSLHGENIRLSPDKTIARRVESFCKGIVFSNRPVKVGEKVEVLKGVWGLRVYLNFLEISTNWSGAVRFGFTNSNPANFRGSLPKYACPDLTNKPGYWAKALAERLAVEGELLAFWATSSGDVHFSLNGEEKGVFFSGVDTRGPLWALVDIYGNSTAVQLVGGWALRWGGFLRNFRDYMNNSRRSLDHSVADADMERWLQPSLARLQLDPPSPSHRIIGPPPDATVAHTPPRVSPACTPSPTRVARPDGVMPQPAQQHLQGPGNPPPPSGFMPLPFHRLRGRSVRLSNDRCVAWKTAFEHPNGYIFTPQSIRSGEKVILRILSSASVQTSGICFGVTSCDPNKLRLTDLPDDPDGLLDRPEYWVVCRDQVGFLSPGDQLVFCIDHNGELLLMYGAVTVGKNGSPESVKMHVDHTLPLWMFWDLSGGLVSVECFGQIHMRPWQPVPRPTQHSHPHSPQHPAVPAPAGQLVVNLPQQELPMPSNTIYESSPHRRRHLLHPHPLSMPTLPPPPPPVPSSSPQSTPPAVSCIQQSPLRVNLPSPMCSTSDQEHLYETIALNCSQVARSMSGRLQVAATTASKTTLMDENGTSMEILSECSVCYEKPVDSVLYMCGHMCMCYECAIQQWRGQGDGQCPICRAIIRDVIRTYRS